MRGIRIWIGPTVILLLAASLATGEPASQTGSAVRSEREAPLTEFQARLAGSSVPTVGAAVAGLSAATSALEEGDYKTAIPAFLETAQLASVLADIADCAVKQRQAVQEQARMRLESQGISWTVSDARGKCAVDVLNAAKVSAQLAAITVKCWYSVGVCYHKQGDDKSALPYLLAVVRVGGEDFAAAWTQVEAITGIKIPPPTATANP